MLGVIETNTIQVWLFALCPGHRCKFHFEQRSAGHVEEQSNYLDCQMAAIMMTGVIETNTIQVWLFALCPGHRCKFHFEQRSAGHLAQGRLLSNLDLLSIGFELLLGFVATRLDLLQHVPLWPFIVRMHW